MKMTMWVQTALRICLAMLFGMTLIAGPIFYILFAKSPLDPWAELARWAPDHIGLRLASVGLFFGGLSLLFAYGASRGAPNPFDEVTASIQRIATRDFRVRLGPFKFREPHELVKIAEAFNNMAAELQRAEELRTTMMADVSHELRTPLTVLEGNLRAALDRVYPLDEAEIANLYGQTRHLIRLVNDLHELALAEAHRLPLDMAPTDLALLVDETLQVFAPLAEERGVSLHTRADHLPAATVDAVRIRQVLHNLLTNALRHTPPGGEIAVSGTLDGDVIVIAVSDTGDGLEPEQLGAIFDRFYRTDKSRSRDTGGTGLGLAIASAIVATHGGNVVASSLGLGQGSTFTIRLPVAAERPSALSAQAV